MDNFIIRKPDMSGSCVMCNLFDEDGTIVKDLVFKNFVVSLCPSCLKKVSNVIQDEVKRMEG